MNNYCRNCGKKLNNKIKCEYCGTEISKKRVEEYVLDKSKEKKYIIIFLIITISLFLIINITITIDLPENLDFLYLLLLPILNFSPGILITYIIYAKEKLKNSLFFNIIYWLMIIILVILLLVVLLAMYNCLTTFRTSIY